METAVRRDASRPPSLTHRWAALFALTAALGLAEPASALSAGFDATVGQSSSDAGDAGLEDSTAEVADAMVVERSGICSGNPDFDPATDLDGAGCVGPDVLATAVGIDACDPSDSGYPIVLPDGQLPGSFIVEDCGPLCEDFPIPSVAEWGAAVGVVTPPGGIALDHAPNVCSPLHPAFLGFAPMRCPDDVPDALRWLYQTCLTVSTASAFDRACASLPPPIATVCEAAAAGGQLSCCEAVLNTRVPPTWLCAYLGATASPAGAGSCTECCDACCGVAWPVSGDANAAENAACRSACATATTPPTTATTLPTTTTTTLSTTTTSTTPWPTITTVTLPPTSSTTVPPTTSTVTPPPSTSTTTLPATTSTTTSSTTTTTFPATPCGKAKIAEPSQLPDQRTCTAANAAKPPAECNGWKTVGEVYDQALGELAESGKAQLYRWRSDTTTCFYLYRFYATGKTSNGVHCYNTSTCDVCAFDAQDVSRPEKWTDLNDLSRGATIQDCSLCHAAGPVTPMDAFFAGVSGETEDINKKCAEKGGPNWIGAPAKPAADAWAGQDVARQVPAPGSAPGSKETCRGCHTKGFIKGSRGFCRVIMIPTFGPNGAMKENGNTFKAKAECVAFATAMGCTPAETAVLCP